MLKSLAQGFLLEWAEVQGHRTRFSLLHHQSKLYFTKEEFVGAYLSVLR